LISESPCVGGEKWWVGMEGLGGTAHLLTVAEHKHGCEGQLSSEGAKKGRSWVRGEAGR